jgi:hypothetical protein
MSISGVTATQTLTIRLTKTLGAKMANWPTIYNVETLVMSLPGKVTKNNTGLQQQKNSNGKHNISNFFPIRVTRLT